MPAILLSRNRERPIVRSHPSGLCLHHKPLLLPYFVDDCLLLTHIDLDCPNYLSNFARRGRRVTWQLPRRKTYQPVPRDRPTGDLATCKNQRFSGGRRTASSGKLKREAGSRHYGVACATSPRFARVGGCAVTASASRAFCICRFHREQTRHHPKTRVIEQPHVQETDSVSIPFPSTPHIAVYANARDWRRRIRRFVPRRATPR